MAEPKVRFKRDDGSSYPDIQKVPFGDVVKLFTEKTKTENEDVLLSCAINGVFLNTELFGHQRGASNKGYKKIRRNTLILSAQNLHLGNANVNQRFDHGIISPAYNTYDIVGCTPDFMAQWVKRDATKKYFYNATTTGASQCRRNVDWNALYEQIFYVPCEEEQQKIADFLSSVDEIVFASEEEVANLEKQKKAVMKKIFSQEVRFKREDGSNFPEWEENALSERTSNFRSGKNIEASKIKNTGLYPVVGGNGIRGYTDTYNHDGLYAVIGRQGALCGNMNLVDGKNYLTEHAVAVQGDEDTDTVFIYYLLDTMNLRQYSGQSAQPGLAVGEIIKLTAQFPCLEEQCLIANFLSDFDEAIAAAKKEMELWKELKKGLLQQMFV